MSEPYEFNPLKPFRNFLRHTLAHTSEQFAPELDSRTYRLNNSSQVTQLALGVLRLEPLRLEAQNGPQQADPPNTEAVLDADPIPEIVLSAGIHGDETAPIELLNELIVHLLSDDFSLRCRVLLIFGNPWAIQAERRQLKHNLNRLFGCSEHDPQPQNPAELEPRRAQQLEHIVSEFFSQADNGTRYHFDLHCAIRPSRREKFAIYPYRASQAWCWPLLAFLATSEIKTALLNNAPTHTFSYYSFAHCQAESVTVELGQVKPFGKNDLTRFSALKVQLLRLLQQQPLGLEAVQHSDLKLYQVAQVVNKISADFQFHFAPEQANFTEFAQGTLLASDGEHKHYVQAEQEAIVFANAQVANGQRALLTLVPAECDLPALRGSE